jgi:tetratricopeptide (TPR) repeat protein
MSVNKYTIDEKIFKAYRALKEERYLEAIELYTSIIDTCDARYSHKSKSKLYTNRARAFAKMNKNDEAIRNCQYAIMLDSSNTAAIILAVECYNVQNKYIPLESVLTNSELHGNRATVLFYMKRYVDTLDNCDREIDINPRYFKIYTKMELFNKDRVSQGNEKRKHTDADDDHVHKKIKNQWII